MLELGILAILTFLSVAVFYRGIKKMEYENVTKQEKQTLLFFLIFLCISLVAFVFSGTNENGTLEDEFLMLISASITIGNLLEMRFSRGQKSFQNVLNWFLIAFFVLFLVSAMNCFDILRKADTAYYLVLTSVIYFLIRFLDGYVEKYKPHNNSQ